MGYKIGKVYRITKNDDPNINYVGSTFTTLRQRWNIHKKNDCSIKKYFDEYGIDKFKIILIKEYEVFAENQKDTKQLRAYEQLWINKFRIKKCCINKRDAFRLLNKEKIKEYRENNKEKFKEYYEKYYENNKEKFKEYQKKFRENNREKILEEKKNYRENNKEEINEKSKKYYQDNKDKILERLKGKIECPICKSLITKRHLSRHQKSKKCIESKI